MAPVGQDLYFRPNVAQLKLPALRERESRKLERRAILSTLRQTGGDKQAAARTLGIGKTTLYRKLRRYQIERTDA
jgi:DNA-binding NtrC family response regulator